VLDQVKAERGLPQVIRTDNGPEFAGRTMQTWAAKNGVELRFICGIRLHRRPCKRPATRMDARFSA
jgi:hypothetical protein